MGQERGRRLSVHRRYGRYRRRHLPDAGVHRQVFRNDRRWLSGTDRQDPGCHFAHGIRHAERASLRYRGYRGAYRAALAREGRLSVYGVEHERRHGRHHRRGRIATRSRFDRRCYAYDEPVCGERTFAVRGCVQVDGPAERAALRCRGRRNRHPCGTQPPHGSRHRR